MVNTFAVAYSLVVLVVAIAGIGFVILRTGDGEESRNDWRELLGAALVIAFLTAMVGSLAI